MARAPADTDEEIDDKRRLYLDAGAAAVQICDEEGQITVYDTSGEREESRRAFSFPARIDA